MTRRPIRSRRSRPPAAPVARTVRTVHASRGREDRDGRDPQSTVDQPTTFPFIERIVAALPARNEAESINSCLESIDIAAGRCGLPVRIVVAADTCNDDTVTVVHRHRLRHAELRVVEGGWHIVGGVRAAAVTAGLDDVTDVSAVWIANTDADCVVEPDWLVRQIRHAHRGAHAVAGVVTLDPRTTNKHLLARFAATYSASGPTHRHVHSANLGVRADAYRIAGGWSTHTMVGEEHALWRRLLESGFDVRQPTDVAVATSSRTTGRVVGGFASRLRRLEQTGLDTARSA